MDAEQLREKIRRALEVFEPVLLGFDANGIQELITASSRPIAMRGASQLILDFDDWSGQQAFSIFAGGGRGLWVVPQAEASNRKEQLQKKFRDITHGGSLAVAYCPWNAKDEAGSLALLRLRLGNAKDEAPMPVVPLPTSREDQCADCKVRLARVPSPRRDAEGEMVCLRCDAAVRGGRRDARQDDESGITLEELSHEGRIAVVSADGNNMGALFASLTSLKETAACSLLVSKIFQEANEAALKGIEDKLSLVTGGDDIRVFLKPYDLLDYVTCLAKEVEQYSSQQDSLHELLRPETKQLLQKIGIGIGAVIAPYHFPASRLLSYAHDYEASSKRMCRGGKARSSFDFAILTSGQEMSQGLKSSNAFELPGGEWKTCRDKAQRLCKLPTSQLSQLFRRHERTDEEQKNLFRYQVARSTEWQRWFEDSGVEWKIQEQLDKNIPDERLILLSQVESYSQKRPA